MKVVLLFCMMTKRADRVKREIKIIFRPDAEKPVNIAKSHPSLYVKACKAFGSWRNAVEACGLDYESSRNNSKWTRDRIVREIKKIGADGGCLRPSFLRKSGMTKLVSAAEYHFGSWRRAVEACGLDYSFGRRKKRIRLSA
ncbi:MAG TPA: hypothetical protein VJV40_06745 [Thermodesulfobacteriota bacterium]|nr:hypothetical protein [Thermodesulfobacteriota bacterium]